MDENSTQVIAEYEGITVKNDVFDEFLLACEKANKPNTALIDAAKFTKESGFK